MTQQSTWLSALACAVGAIGGSAIAISMSTTVNVVTESPSTGGHHDDQSRGSTEPSAPATGAVAVAAVVQESTTVTGVQTAPVTTSNAPAASVVIQGADNNTVILGGGADFTHAYSSAPVPAQPAPVHRLHQAVKDGTIHDLPLDTPGDEQFVIDYVMGR